MPKVIGYMAGTDSEWLTTLGILGYVTLPLSNGFDGHGLNIQLISNQRKVDLVLCWLHKLIPTPGEDVTMDELLARTTMFEIPVLVVCPGRLHGKVQGRSIELPRNAQLIDPADVVERITQILV